MNSRIAVLLACVGYKVFPCLPDKRPIVEGGWHSASDDVSTVKGWAALFDRGYIGLACEPSFLFVLDVDMKGSKNGLQTLHNVMRGYGVGEFTPPPGIVTRTPSGGYHFYFSKPDFDIPNKVDIIGPGCDARTRGYVCAGDAYPAIVGDYALTRPKQPPDWLLQAIKDASKPKQTERHQAGQTVTRNTGGIAARIYSDYIGRAVEGTRNNTLYSMALQWRYSNVPQAEAESYLARFCSETAYPETEAQRTLESAYKADIAGRTPYAERK